MALRIAAQPELGVIDFFMSPPGGVEALAASRVIPNRSGVEYVFTQFQAPAMPDELFASAAHDRLPEDARDACQGSSLLG